MFARAANDEQASWTRVPGMALFLANDTCCSVATPGLGCVSASEGASWYERARMDLIQHVATGMTHSAKAKNLLAKFRFRFADTLDPSRMPREEGDEDKNDADVDVVRAIIDNLRDRADADAASKTTQSS